MEWAQYERMRSATLPFAVDCVPPSQQPIQQQAEYPAAPAPKKFKSNAAVLRTSSHGEMTWDQILEKVGPKAAAAAAADTASSLTAAEEPVAAAPDETLAVVTEDPPSTTTEGEDGGKLVAPAWLVAALNTGRRQPPLEPQALYERLLGP
jgi:hypothetical protein